MRTKSILLLVFVALVSACTTMVAEKNTSPDNNPDNKMSAAKKGPNKKHFLSPVSPWQRQHLSNKAMAWEVDPVEAALEQHITFSKEASSGGEQSSGGGCGCN